MNSDIIVIDDIIPKTYQDIIERELHGKNFQWYFINDVTADTKDASAGRMAAQHQLVQFGQIVSPHWGMFHMLPHIACAHANYDLKEITLARAFMQYPLSNEVYGNRNEDMWDAYHVDQLIPHMVVLYYVHDADGDTYILDNMYNGNNDSFPEGGIKKPDQKVVAKVTPKKGRVVMFNGHRYHSAQQPRKGMRTVLNYNVHDFDPYDS